jgi:mannitol/fructose-specific phosphotransferase system IIA component (Ntr-type)
MNLSALLKPERIILELKSKKKIDILGELLRLIRPATDVDLILPTLLKREELGSTGVGKGIAIPHCRSLVIDKLELAVGRSEKGVNFQSLDKKPSHLIFLIMAPPQDPGNQYLITLGKVAMVAQEIVRQKKIFEPQTSVEFIKLVKELEGKIK